MGCQVQIVGLHPCSSKSFERRCPYPTDCHPFPTGQNGELFDPLDESAVLVDQNIEGPAKRKEKQCLGLGGSKGAEKQQPPEDHWQTIEQRFD